MVYRLREPLVEAGSYVPSRDPFVHSSSRLLRQNALPCRAQGNLLNLRLHLHPHGRIEAWFGHEVIYCVRNKISPHLE